MRLLYEILMTGAANSDESMKLRDAGWNWTPGNHGGCRFCGTRGPAYLKDGGCLGCRKEQRSKIDAAWFSDAALSTSCEGPFG